MMRKERAVASPEHGLLSAGRHHFPHSHSFLTSRDERCSYLKVRESRSEMLSIVPVCEFHRKEFVFISDKSWILLQSTCDPRTEQTLTSAGPAHVMVRKSTSSKATTSLFNGHKNPFTVSVSPAAATCMLSPFATQRCSQIVSLSTEHPWGLPWAA